MTMVMKRGHGQTNQLHIGVHFDHVTCVPQLMSCTFNYDMQCVCTYKYLWFVHVRVCACMCVYNIMHACIIIVAALHSSHSFEFRHTCGTVQFHFSIGGHWGIFWSWL